MDMDSMALRKYLLKKKGGKQVLETIEETSKQENIELIDAFEILYSNHQQYEKIKTGIKQEKKFLKKDDAGEARTIMDASPDGPLKSIYEGQTQIPKTQKEPEQTLKTKQKPSEKETATVLPAKELEQPDESELDIGAAFEDQEALPKADPLGAEFFAESADSTSKIDPKQNYIPIKKLGEGGMGLVMLVKDPALNREVALKKFKGKLIREYTERFINEAQITGQLEHPNVPPVHVYLADKLEFIMKYVQGKDLHDIIKELKKKNKETREKFTQNEMLRIIIKACDGMAYAHSKGIIHRDIKPANIMVGKFGEVLVMDWGLAKKTGTPDKVEDSIIPQDAKKALTLEGHVMGTPMYMSPEQASGTLKEIDHQSDIYSLGATLFEMLTYEPPIEGETVINILNNVIQGKRKKMRRTPKELESITNKSMALNKKKRYQTAEELSSDIQRYLDGELVKAHKYSFIDKAKRFAKKYAMQIASGAAIMLALAGGTGAALYASGQAARAEAGKAKAEALTEQEKTARAEAEAGKAKAETKAEKAEKEKAIVALQVKEETDRKRNAGNTQIDLGTMYLNKGNYDKAIAEYTEAIKIYPDSAGAHYDRGLALRCKAKQYKNQELKNEKERNAKEKETKELLQKSLEDMIKAIELDNKNTMYQMEYAQSLEYTGKIDEAEKQFRDGIELAKKNNQKVHPLVFYNFGAFYSRTKRPTKAIEQYKKYLEIIPTDGEAYAAIANEYINLEQDDKAKEYAQTALDKKYYGAYYELGVVYCAAADKEYLKKNDPKAKELYSEAERLLTLAKDHRPDRIKLINDMLNGIKKAFQEMK